ncbi:PAS fold family protein, partial [Vibrio parahaemolyticus AQ3810]
ENWVCSWWSRRAVAWSRLLNG